jgi:hypothetical protein
MLVSSLMFAQSGSSSGTDNSKLETDVQKLLDAVAAQQKAMAAQQKEMADQQKAMAEQQRRISEQEQEIAKLKQQVTSQAQPAQASMVNASLTVANPNPALHTVSDVAQDQPKESPLSFRIGAADFTPGGFVDFENIFRSTNTGNVTSTNFGGIPFSNTVAGHLTEYRSTGQYSRFNIKTHTKFGANDVTGYVEFDFNGNDAANVFVTSNPHTDRLRLYWLDLRRGKWEFLGGQTWGLQTPNRVGVSPNPSDISTGFHEDAGIGVGYNYTRAGEFRAAYHINDGAVWAVAVQNPQQFVGVGEILFPFAFNAQLGAQFDAGNVPGAPNVGPDILTKLSLDHDFGARHVHLEGGALETAVKVTVLPVGGTGFVHHTKVGGGAFGAIAADLIKGSQGRGIRFVANGMWGNGIGRYLNGLAPNAVVVPVQTGAATFDANVSLVHSGDVVVGFEMLPHPKAQFGVYYGGMYAQRNFFCDVTSPVVGACAGHPFGGFGGINSPNSANRSVQEGTIDWTQTMWRNPQYGAVLLVTQASYVTRSPWFVAAGAPKNAHLGMGYVSLRYVLP